MKKQNLGAKQWKNKENTKTHVEKQQLGVRNCTKTNKKQTNMGNKQKNVRKQPNNVWKNKQNKENTKHNLEKPKYLSK